MSADACIQHHGQFWTGKRNNFQLTVLLFPRFYPKKRNNSRTPYWTFCCSASHSTLPSCSHLACMPSITFHHTLLGVCMPTHHHIFRNPIIQRSSWASLCFSPLQNANVRLQMLAWMRCQAIWWHKRAVSVPAGC